ncbi:hypothetical protein, partial [Falsiroseomonas oryzae]|uniref:hypothetical protein n=1 Tax=Falsiroseomonas oryzae TaxID=2766473 RepID=UPI0022EA67D9
MRNLLQDVDRDRLVAPLAGLAAEVTVAGAPHRALAEAEGSAFFPAEANARAVELLLLPGVREANQALSDAVLDFVMAMAEQAPASRRAVAGLLDLRSEDPHAFEVITPFHRLTGDLSRGEIRQEPRGLGRLALRHTGNLVEFVAGRHRTCADVEDAITGCAVERRGAAMVLRFAAAIRGQAGFFAPREVEAGTLETEYEVRPDTPVLRVTTRFTAARRLSRVRVTTALDALEEEGLGATAARLLEGSAWRDVAPPAAPGALRWVAGEPVGHVAIGRAG